MKIPALLLMCATGILFASQTLSIDQQQALKIYNHKPSQATTVLKRMQQFANISKMKAVEVADPFCNGNQKSIKLVHKREYLLYSIKGKNCSVYINALDGTIIPSETLND